MGRKNINNNYKKQTSTGMCEMGSKNINYNKQKKNKQPQLG
jgi:hypothetical protein